MFFIAASEEKLKMKLCTWRSILTSKKKRKPKQKLQIKFWDVIKTMHLKAAFLPHKTNKETDS